MIVKVLIFAGGVATGLLIAKYYARSQVSDAIDQTLGKFVPAPVTDAAKKVIVPLVA